MNTEISNIDTPTKDVFEFLAQRIRAARQTVFEVANRTLVDLYWQIGQVISIKVKEAGWGKGVVTQLAAYIATEIADAKGFSDKNLWRMKQFYEMYSSDEKLSPAVRELSWTHNITIMSRCKTNEERLFYIEALDRDVKKPHENPSIGILLCHDKDDEVVEYALSRSLSPTLVAQYQLQLPDKRLFENKLKEI